MTNRNLIKETLDKAKENGVEYPMMYVGNYFFSLAPEHGINKGAVYIKYVDGKSKIYVGKITPEGSIQLTRSFDGFIPLVATNIVDIHADIAAIMSDPYTSLKAHGKKTGICSCCGRKLTNKLSVRLGIGPICREKYGFADMYDADDIREQPDLLDL